MADALLSAFLSQMAAIIGELADHQLNLVTGLDNELENLKRNLQAIQMVLKDAERRQWNDDAVKLWMDDLKDVSYDMDQVLDEWNTAIIRSAVSESDSDPTSFFKKVEVRFSALARCFYAGPLNKVRFRLDLGHKLENLNVKLDKIASRKAMFNFSTTARSDEPLPRKVSNSIVDVSKVYGQDEYKKVMKDRLLGGTSGFDAGRLCIVPVVGMGGIGKTTLAKFVYNDDEVKSQFGKRLWVCVSDPFDVIKIANAIIEQLTGQAPHVADFESVMQNMIALIRDEKFLLVLDDVWTDDYQTWELLEKPLMSCGSSGSRVIVTTRKVEVVRMMGIRDNLMIRIRELSETDCWMLFTEIAFFGKTKEDIEELERIGREIVAKCNGLPLAAKALGSLLRVKRTKEEWLDVLQSKIWRLEKVRENLFHPFLLSYLDLSPVEKRCLSYCAVFPKDQVIEKKKLIYMWMAQGYFSSEKYEDGERFFDNLLMRSFFQDFKRLWEGNIYACKMHDIVHDFVQFLTVNEHSSVEMNNLKEKTEFSSRHLSLVISSDARQSQTPSPILSLSCKKNLHSFMLLGQTAVEKRVAEWCLQFMSLRTLIIETFERIDVPQSIGELVHLRYLALSSSKIDTGELREFPRSLGNLCNLQTLILKGFSLPEEVAKLANLRYLSCTGHRDLQFTILPKGAARLTNLLHMNARLSPFSTVDRKENKLDLGDLSKLSHLRGLRLQDVGIDEGHVEGAKQAQLSRQTNLQSLDLLFSKTDHTMKTGCETHKSTLEALQPPPEVTFMAIMQYSARDISPTWMISSLLLRNLKFLGLFSFPNCETLPPLGKLESLETLVIRDMKSLAKVGLEFLGISETSCSNARLTVFPKVKSIEFSSMPSWIEWEGLKGWNRENTRIMPCLERLEFYRCKILKALPEFVEAIPLKDLVITASCRLELACRENGNEWDKIRHVPNIKFRH